VTAHDPSADGSSRRHVVAPHYEITVRGHLDPHWSTWFGGLELIRTDDGTTVISGRIVDQSALHGLLQKLRDLGIPLVSLTTTPPTNDTTRPERP
jgi:hypothetical protein